MHGTIAMSSQLSATALMSIDLPLLDWRHNESIVPTSALPSFEDQHQRYNIFLDNLSSTIASLLARNALATPAEDLTALQVSCATAADAINGSLNNSAALNTAELVQDIGYQVGASQMNLISATTTSVTSTSASTSVTLGPLATAASSSGVLDDLFYTYAGSLNTLAEALLRRGQATHGEPDMPVFLAIQGLGSAIEDYTLQLRSSSLVSQNAFIFSLAVENDLIEAESAWAGQLSGGASIPVSQRRAARSHRILRSR